MKSDVARCKQFVPLIIIIGSMLLVYLATHVEPNRRDIPAPVARCKNAKDCRVEGVIGSQTRSRQKDILVPSHNVTLDKPLRNPEYHRHWDVNCSAVFAGNETIIKMLNRKIQQEQSVKSLMPSDSTVVTWTNDCELYKRQRGYPRLANSEEEAAFPLAYIIATHKGSAQVERLLRAIYQPQNVYCIHPDAKSPSEFHQAIFGLANCFDNVFIASKLENVQYAGHTRVLADINCMKDLMGPPASRYPWKYVINLCGQDFPLKTNLEIVRQLKACNGHNEIKAYTPPKGKKERTIYKYITRNHFVVRTKQLKEPAPHNLTVYDGSAYYAATRDFVRYVLQDVIATDFLDWLGDTYCPDETYWATLQRAPGAPGGDPDDTGLQIRRNSVRFVLWNFSPICHGKYVRQVCIFRIGDLQYLQKQPELFANKFYYEYDPVTLQCLERALDVRVGHPDESENLSGFNCGTPTTDYVSRSLDLMKV